jgi:hypothetical protein
MSGWLSPLKPVKEKKEKPPPTREQLTKLILKSFGKPKCVISASHAKKILNSVLADSPICEWVERWIDDFVRGHSYPPQLRSDEFYALLPTYFDPTKVLEVLEKIRVDFHQAFPLLDSRPAVDDFVWLPMLLQSDTEVVSFLPSQYLC